MAVTTTVSAVVVPTKQAEIDALLYFGLFISSITYPDIPMTQALQNIASNQTNGVNITAAADDAGHSSLIPADFQHHVHALIQLIDSLPHDVSSSKILTGFLVVGTIAISAVCLRLYARSKILGRIRPDDKWAAISALFCLVIMCYYAVAVTWGKIGMHIYDVSFHEYSRFMYLLPAGEIVFALGLAPVKMTFLVFYYSLSPDKGYRRNVIAAGVVAIFLSLAGLLGMILQCRPYNYWDHIFEMKCLPQVTLFTIWGVMTIVSDFWILFLPITKVAKLDMKKKEKLQVIGMFGAGGLICIVSIFRVIELNNAAVRDNMYAVTPASLFAICELGLGLVISCLPALKHLFVGHVQPLEFRNAAGYLPTWVIRTIRGSSKRNSLSKGAYPWTTTLDPTNVDPTNMDPTRRGTLLTTVGTAVDVNKPAPCHAVTAEHRPENSRTNLRDDKSSEEDRSNHGGDDIV